MEVVRKHARRGKEPQQKVLCISNHDVDFENNISFASDLPQDLNSSNKHERVSARSHSRR